MIIKASWSIRTKILKIIFCLSPPMTSAQYQSSKPGWGQFYQSPATPLYKAAAFLHVTLHLITETVANVWVTSLHRGTASDDSHR